VSTGVWFARPTNVWRRYRRPDVGTVRPSGTGYTTLESVDTGGSLVSGKWVWGSGVTLQSVLTTAAPNVLTLPVGIFEFDDFAQSGQWGILVPATSGGIAGSGPGTVLRMRAGTSTKASSVPVQSTAATNPLYLIRATGGSDQQFTNFQLQGTDQQTDPNTGKPHCYNGLMVGLWPDGHPATLDNLLINGIRGDAGSQPGETFGINVYSCLDVTIKNCEVSGYMVDGTTRVGSSPIGFNSFRGTPGRVHVRNCYLHDATIGQFTMYQTSDVTTVDVQSTRNTRAFNHERTARVTHVNPVAVVDAGLAPNGMHFAYANPQLTAWPDSPNTIQNPAHPGDSHLDGKLAVMVQDTYAGAANQQTTLPTILDAAGNPVTFTTVATRYH